MGEVANETFTLNVLYGEKKIEPIKHIATWRTHELFDMESEIMRWTDCDDMLLAMARGTGMHIEFTNERPEPKNWLRKLLRL